MYYLWNVVDSNYVIHAIIKSIIANGSIAYIGMIIIIEVLMMMMMMMMINRNIIQFIVDTKTT